MKACAWMATSPKLKKPRGTEIYLCLVGKAGFSKDGPAAERANNYAINRTCGAADGGELLTEGL